MKEGAPDRYRADALAHALAQMRWRTALYRTRMERAGRGRRDGWGREGVRGVRCAGWAVRTRPSCRAGEAGRAGRQHLEQQGLAQTMRPRRWRTAPCARRCTTASSGAACVCAKSGDPFRTRLRKPVTAVDDGNRPVTPSTTVTGR